MLDDRPPETSAANPDPSTAVKAESIPMPPIALEPTGPKLPPAPVIGGKKDSEPKDSFRELIETVVFVVVLVLMLKTFLAEAFVIPTGSMATTLLGYHHKVVCKECGRPSLVNASEEAEPRGNERPKVEFWVCENCEHVNQRDVQKGQPR